MAHQRLFRERPQYRLVDHKNIKPENVMKGVHLIGHGGIEKLVYKEDLPIPVPNNHEVLIQVTAAGVNNTDINTRLGWYSKKVSTATENSNELIVSGEDVKDAAWDGQSLKFPRIQGADVCGTIVRVGDGVSRDRGALAGRVAALDGVPRPGLRPQRAPPQVQEEVEHIIGK